MGDPSRAAERPTTSSRPPPSLSGALAPGTHVGRYLVLKKLGRGGMGVVYMAYDEELDRRVALKLLATDDAAAPSGHADRLLREAQAMAKLSHPSVVSVYDVGTAGETGDRLFLAMEYVDGVSLRAWREAQPRRAREIVAMYAQAAQGLEAAHAAGILHRDFKPENVLVDARGRAKVLDFGLARIDPVATSLDDVAMAMTAAGDGVASRPPLTRVGAIVGTPEYMAPEQLRGERAEARSDVFAFSVALYEALYGERPHGGKNARELLEEIVAERVKAAPRGARVPRRVRAVLLRGLRASADDRWPTMRAMIEALGGAVTSGRNVALVGAAVVASVAVVAAVAMFARARAPVCAGADKEIAQAWGGAQRGAVKRAFVGSGNPRGEDTFARVAAAHDAYAASWAKMRTESCEATRVRQSQSGEALDLRTACLDQRRRVLAATAELFARADPKLVDDAVNAVRAVPDLGECADIEALRSPYSTPHDPQKRRRVDEMRSRLAEATALMNAGRFVEANQPIGRVLADAQEEKNRQVEAEARLLSGQEAIELGASDPEREYLAAALEADALGDDLTEATAWTRLVYVAGYVLGKYELSVEYARLAASAIERAGSPLALRGKLAQFEGHAVWIQGKILQSVPHYRSALELLSRAFGPDSVEAASIESDLSDIADNLGHVRQSTQLEEGVLRKYESSYGATHPRTLSVLIGLSGNYLGIAAYEVALEYARRGIEGASTPRTVRSAKEALSRAYLGLGEVKIALATFNESLEGETGWRRASAFKTQALFCLRRRLDPIALEFAEKAVQGYASEDVGRDDERQAREIRALALVRTGHARDALRDAERVLTEEEAEAANGEPFELAYLALAEADLATGDAARALAALERGYAVCETIDEYPELCADLHIDLARALLATHGDLSRARDLAGRAAAEYDAVRLPEQAKQARALTAKLGAH